MKKSISMLICAVVILWLVPIPARADVGPKPSVVIDFKGLEGETYYATLLSNVRSTGPHTALDENNQDYARYKEGDEGYDIFLKFVDYRDPDGFYFLQFFQDCSKTQQFKWGYYPPKEFKILLYFPETDRFVVNNQAYGRYAFDSYFTAARSNDGLAVTKSYNYAKELPALVARILLTIAIELLIALLFGFREGWQLRFLILVNVVTQIALNMALNIINYLSGSMAFVFFYILLELAIFLAEGVLYARHLKTPDWKTWMYAFTANSASFALGLLLAFLLPGMF